MSNLEKDPAEAVCGGTRDIPGGPVTEVLEGRDVVLGGTRGIPVYRTLPNKIRRMVGAWCFIDHYRGPTAMRVPPHPHTSLQTVTWLLAGEVRHTDSVGSDQVIRAGELNIMTAGYGISHAEVGPGPLHGVQLWVALPGAAAGTKPGFAHHPDLPLIDGRLRLLAGSVDGVAAPTHTYTPLFGAEVVLDGDYRVPLDPAFEHAALTLDGSPVVAGVPLADGPLLYLGTGRSSLALGGTGRVLILGGAPFEERIIMWWNFIGRSHEEVVTARADWMGGLHGVHDRFGTVAYDGPALPAPDMPTTRLVPKGRLREG